MTTIKTAKQIVNEYYQLPTDSEQPRYVPLAEYEALQAILKRWQTISWALEFQPFLEHKGTGEDPELTQLIADTQAAVKGE